MIGVVRRGTAFFFGFGFALLPAVGPFLALLYVISARWRVRRADLVWLALSACFIVGPWLAGHAGPALPGALQFAAGWFIYRAFAEMRPAGRSAFHSSLVGAGLLTGLGLVVALSLLQVEAWNFATAKTLAQAIVWQSSPALMGHTVLVLGGLIAVVAPNRYVRVGALAISALGVLVSGSLEAALAWIAIASVLQLAVARHSWRSRIAEALVLSLMVAITVGLGPTLGWGEIGYLLQSTDRAEEGNMLQGTELPTGDWWDASWVTFDTYPVTLGGDGLVAYRVTKSGDASWLRLQQAVEIAPGTTYTASTWLADAPGGAQPGIQAWGRHRAGEAARSFVVAGSWADADWRAGVSGAGSLVASGVSERDGDWRRVYVTFRYSGPHPIPLFIGLAPDARAAPGGRADFAGFQLERGELGPYQPGSASRALPLGVARVPYWQAAWEAIRERPLMGWGETSFARYLREHRPGHAPLALVPEHAHNLYLQVWFERGVFGLVAVLLFLAAIAAPAALRRDIPYLAVLVAVMYVNFFDTTLFYGGVFYPLVAVAGWRSSFARASATDADRASGVRTLTVRLMLSAADTIGALVAMVVASRVVSSLGLRLETSPSILELPTAAFYALLLWPAMTWREGLHPGYGLTQAQELKRQVFSCAYAGLFLMAGMVFFQELATLSLPLIIVTAACSMATLPMFRAGAKRALHALELWGRPVAILGAGDSGRRIARALRAAPLQGLHPVAFFDDDPALEGRRILGLPVQGRIEHAQPFAGEAGIEHLIVALPNLSPNLLRHLLDHQGRSYRAIQYLPDVSRSAVQDVRATTLDGRLAIEVRNNLASRRNRLVKRTIDLLAGLACLVVLSPLLLALALWIRIDSRGQVFFRSERVGRDGKPFACLKFRTMAGGAEQTLDEMMARDPSLRDEYARFHKLVDDPRVTRAGRILRTFSLDELPQLFNVVAGDMSLVGPRPYLTRELHHMEDFRSIILQARPGITGHWQISARNEVTFRQRLEMEAHYVRNWSIWWDIVILVNTIPAVLQKRGR